MLSISIMWLVVVVWLLLRAARQGRVLIRLDATPEASGEASCSIEIIVPARNEGGNIEHCVNGLLSQSLGIELVTIVDDASTDDTASIIETIADRDSRLRLIRAPALPPGWTGKSHACWLAAREARAEWLCFIDADVVAEAKLCAMALEHARHHQLDFLSLTPRQVLVSFAERLIMPCGFYLLSFTQDLAPMQAPRGAEATATGQFILVRRAAYLEVGGHEAVREAISEDVALARRMKGAGLRVSLAGGDRLMSTRMYTGWKTLWIGVSKNLVDMLGGGAATVSLVAVSLVAAWAAVLVPVWSAIGCMRDHGAACVALAIGTTASAAAFALHVAGAYFFRIPIWYGFLFPLGYTLGAMMAIDSVRRRATGRTRWKDRTYP